jgi:hypothetical protein
MKIRPLGVTSFHANRRTERRDKTNSSILAVLRTRLKTNEGVEVIKPCYMFEGFDECIQNCHKKTWKGSVRRPRCRWGDVLNLVQAGCEDTIPVSTARGKGMQSCSWCVVCPESNHCSDVTIKLHTPKLICLLFRMNDTKILDREIRRCWSLTL